MRYACYRDAIHMTYTIEKADVIEFRERWLAANAVEREELRRTSVEQKLRQLASLMTSLEALGSDESNPCEKALVWDRWNVLRTKFRRV